MANQQKSDLNTIVTITLNPAIDRIACQAGFFVDSAGGKGINVARALHALGVPVRALTLAGGPTGKQLAMLLSQEKISYDLFPVKGATRVNVTRQLRGGVVERVMGQGPVLSLRQQEAVCAFILRQIKPVDGVVFSGSLPPGFSLRRFSKLIRCARGRSRFVAVDASGPALKAALKEGVDIIKPNREEAEAVLGYKLSSKRLIKKALHTFAGCGIKKVLVSLGKDGLAGFDGVKEVFVRTAVMRGGHMVGCGDAALAGFLAAQRRGKDLGESLYYAAACGAANARVKKPGDISKKGVAVWL